MLNCLLFVCYPGTDFFNTVFFLKTSPLNKKNKKSVKSKFGTFVIFEHFFEKKMSATGLGETNSKKFL